MSELYYLYYLKLLNGFIFVKETIIAQTYLVFIIFKLKSNNNFYPNLHKNIQVHYVFLL